MAPVDEGCSSWQKCKLYTNVDDLMEYEPLELMRLAEWKKRPVVKLGLSDEAKVARDALADDPYSMRWIYELARIYDQECKWDKVEAVLLRGWKRAGELDDPEVRFSFLMKLCEVSYYVGRYRQALAVFRDIEEPSSAPRSQIKAYWLLGCRVSCTNQDVPGALKAFARVVDNEETNFATRMLGFLVFDLKRAGAYETARAKVEKMLGRGITYSSILEQLDMVQIPTETMEDKQERLLQRAKYGVAAVVLMIALFIMYVIEQWSLKKLQDKGVKLL